MASAAAASITSDASSAPCRAFTARRASAFTRVVSPACRASWAASTAQSSGSATGLVNLTASSPGQPRHGRHDLRSGHYRERIPVLAWRSLDDGARPGPEQAGHGGQRGLANGGRAPGLADVNEDLRQPAIRAVEEQLDACREVQARLRRRARKEDPLALPGPRPRRRSGSACDRSSQEQLPPPEDG